MIAKLFSELGLSPEMLKAIDKLGFEKAAPIQGEAIPVLMAGKDVVGQSMTGSGKTAAFGIPAVEKVDAQKRATQVLILCPTRELAVQVSEEIHKLAFFKRGLHALPIYGGQSYERQFMGLKQGAQIVIGTPGRVMDHMRRGTLRLDSLKMVILDEADVMLNMGFRDDIEFILQAVPPTRQTVFFSATMPKPIQDLIGKYAREPVSVRIQQAAMTVPTVEQFYYEIDRRYKIEALTRLIDIHDLKLGIVFCNTKRMVDDLVDHLNAQGYSADRLHGDMTQAMRDRVMNKFRKSGLEFLVATDVAARGIDVDDIEVVFNYDLPYDVEDYVHRIGRTGRAGRAGRAISFVAGRELFQIRNIERYTKMRIQRAQVPTLDEVEEARAGSFLDKIRLTLKSGEFKVQESKVARLLEEGFSSTDIAAAALHQLAGGETAAAPAVKTKGSFAERPERPERSERPERAPRAEYAERPERRAYERPARPEPRDYREERAPQRREYRDERPARAYEAPPRARPPAKENSRPAPPATAPVTAPAGSPAPMAPPAAKPAPLSFKEKQFKAPFPRAAVPKASRATPADQTRLWMSVGTEHGVATGDVVGAILGETGLPAQTVGTVDIRERHAFVDVSAEHANGIIAKLNRARIKGNKLKVKVA